MAGSDYEQLTFGADARVLEKRVGKCEVKSLESTVTLRNGLIIEPYKNFLYLAHSSMWDEKTASFTKPTICQIVEGYIEIAGAAIYAKWYGKHTGRMVWCVKEYHEKEPRVYCGIAVYGHMDYIKFYVERKGHRYVG